MATFVEHKKTGRLFVLVSGGFGVYQSAGANSVDRMKIHEQGTCLKVCVCDRQGDLGWFNSNEVRVINVDGLDIKEELKDLSFLETREKRVDFK